MTVVKTERDAPVPRQPSTHSLNSGPVSRAPAGGSSSEMSSSNLANPDFSKPPEKELELPPRMKELFEVSEATEPVKVHIRYNEFKAAEERLANAPVQEGEQIKL